MITPRVLVILGHAAVAGAATTETPAERVRLMEGEVTRHREVLAENENLRRGLGAAEQRLAMGEQRAGERDGGAAAVAAPGPSSGQVVGTRLLNKPRTFTGLHSEWKIWSFGFEAYLFAVHPRLGDLLNRVSRMADALTVQTDLDAALNAQLYNVLVSVTSDVAEVEVRKAPRGDGLAAWWYLLRELALKETNRFAAMLGRTIRCEFAGPARTNLAEFEQLVRECADQSGEVISDNMKRGVIMSGVKNEKLADHLSLNASRLVTCDDLETELTTFCLSQRRWAAAGSGGDGAVPMQAGHLAADCRKKKAGEKMGREVASLTDATQVRSSASTATTALKGGSAGSQGSLAPAIEASHVAAVLAQMQLRQQRGRPSTSATVRVANIQVAGDADIPTPEEYNWQVGMMYAATQCDALPVTVGDSVGFDWALCVTGSGPTTCPQKLPLCESATGDEVKSMGARMMAAESDGIPLQIEFQFANVKRAVVSADTFTEGGHVPIFGKGPYILLADGRRIKLCRSGGTFWLRISRTLRPELFRTKHLLMREMQSLMPTPIHQHRRPHWRHQLPAMIRINQTIKDISVRAFDDSEKAELYCGFLEKPRRLMREGSQGCQIERFETTDPGRLIPLVCIDYSFFGDIKVDPLAVLNILEYQSGAIECAQMRDPRSNGAIENANKMVEGMFSSLRASIESRYSTKPTLNLWVMSWMIRHAGWPLSVCPVKEDGLAPYQRPKGRARGGAICEFGETVMYKIQKVAHHKAEIRWGKAVWVGKDNRTDEHFLATAAGRKTARAINGRVEEEETSLLSLDPPTSNLHRQHRLQHHLLSYMVQGQIKGGMELGVIEVDWNGAAVTEKPRRKQKVIAGLFVNMAIAVVALTCDVISYGSEMDTNKHSLYDRESTYQNLFGARSGRKLDLSLVRQGREKEHRQMGEFQVFDRVLENFAKGKRVRGKWVDDERYDDDGRESVRSRCVAMQFAWDVRGDTFAGAPPLAAFRLVVFFASTLHFAGIGCDGMLALYDVSVAFVHAYIDEGIYVVPPKGEEPEGIVYQLKRALYGTRRASFLFLNLIMEGTEKGGFVRINVTVQVFYHTERLLMMIVHGNDFLAGGRRDALDWLGELVRSLQGFGTVHDRKHVEILVCTMLSRKIGESNATKRTITPSSKTIRKDYRESSDELSAEYATTYRSMAPAALYVARDRFDIQQAVGYLVREHPQFELFFGFQRMPKVIVAEVDSDWASEPGRRSVDGGFLVIGSHLVDGWSGQQGNRALSGAEAEFTGIVNGSARGIGLRSVTLEMGFEVTLQVNAGSSGAEGIASRLACGKAQEKVRDRTITTAKFHADVNRADMQTKPLEGPRFLKLLAFLSFRTPSGRTQVFGVMLAATMLGGVQGPAVIPCDQAV
ncbi:unnamed protein product, partial [Prorocentrum cordatum]